MPAQSGWADDLYGNLTFSPPTYPQTYGPTASATPSTVDPSLDYPSVTAPAVSTPAPAAAPASTGSSDEAPSSSPFANSQFGGSSFSGSQFGGSPYSTVGSPVSYSSVGAPVNYSNVGAPVGYSNVASPVMGSGVSGPSSFNEDVGYANEALSAGKLVNSTGLGVPGLGAAGDALGIANGIERGGVAGYAGAALSAGKLANFGGANIPGLGIASDALGIYNGIKQGGVQGYTGAAVDAAQLYGAASAADVAAGGAGLAGGAAAASVGAYVAPAAALYELYGIDQHASQLSPVKQANTNFSAAAYQTSQAKALLSGQTGGYMAPGETAQSEAQNDEENAALEQYLGDMTMHMSAEQLNSNWGYDNAHPAPAGVAGYANPGGYGMGQTNRTVRLQ